MASVADINSNIRFFLGNADESFITDADLNRIIQETITANPSYSDCDVYYYSLLSCIRFNIRSSQKSSTSSAGGLKRRKQKEGGIEVEEEYHQATESTSSTGLETLLKDLIKNPNQIGCVITSLSVAAGKPSGNILIGGVSIAEKERVVNNPDRVDPWSSSSPLRSHLSSNKGKLIG